MAFCLKEVTVDTLQNSFECTVFTQDICALIIDDTSVEFCFSLVHFSSEHAKRGLINFILSFGFSLVSYLFALNMLLTCVKGSDAPFVLTIKMLMISLEY